MMLYSNKNPSLSHAKSSTCWESGQISGAVCIKLTDTSLWEQSQTDTLHDLDGAFQYGVPVKAGISINVCSHEAKGAQIIYFFPHMTAVV